jgi:EmrB/QacA subfamily drug resistance transporter
MMSRTNLVALIIACAFLMQTLDSTIIVTAVPNIAASFGVNPVQLSAALTAYIVSVAVFIPVTGWLADRFGSRTVFQIAIVIFTLGSVLCGLSNNLGELAAARVLQGIGGAAVTPVGRLVLLRTAKKSEYVRAAAYLSVPAQIGPLLGPPLGGFLTTYVSWRWIFLINIPIGLVGILLTARFMQNFRESESHPLDWTGFVVSGAAMSCTMYGLDLLSHAGSPSLTAGTLAAGLALGLLAIRHARRAEHSLIDLSLLRYKSFAANFWGGTLFRMGSGALPFLLPLLFQVVFGMTAFASGLLTFATAAGSIGMRAITPRILRQFGFRRVLIWNELIFAASILVFVFFSPSTPAIIIFLMLLASGFFQGLQLSSLSALPYSGLASNQMSAATSLSQLAQQVSRGLGIALAAVALQVSLSLSGSTHLSSSQFVVAFSVLAGVSLLSVVNFVALPPDCGSDLSGHNRTGRISPLKADDPANAERRTAHRQQEKSSGD